jgi:hypothetical protein|nr:MAG TPA: hypothetical protein [Caudoviricetes sp.]
MAANDELTMSDLTLAHTNPDETVTPETFDLAAWIAGVTPVERTVTVYAHGHLFSILSALEAQYNEAKAAVNVDDMRDAKDKMRTVANQIRASALDITVQGRSADWVQRFRKDCEDRGLDGDETTLEQLAAQVIVPEGITPAMLATLRDRVEPQVVALLQAVAAVNTQAPRISVPS